MNNLTKLFTILRGNIQQAGEAIIDSQPLNLFAQQIRDCEATLNIFKQELIQVITNCKQIQRQIKLNEKEIHTSEQQASFALSEGLDESAQQLAIGIIQTRKQQQQLRQQLEYQQHQQASLEQNLKQAGRQIKSHQLEFARLKSQLNINRATQSLTYNSQLEAFSQASQTLEKIQQTVQYEKDIQKARLELENELYPQQATSAQQIKIEAEQLLQQIRIKEQ